MNALTITHYVPEDRPALIAGCIDLQETERKISEYCLPGEEIADIYLDHLLWLNQRQSGALLVAKIDGKVVGFIACRIERDESLTTTEDLNYHGYISDAWTRSEFRGEGIFSALCAAAEEHFSKHPDVKVMKLNVLAKNIPAITAYGKNGYRVQELTYAKRIKP